MKYFDRFAGLFSAVAIILICVMIAWLGVAGPVWRAVWTASAEQWLGFAGSVFGGLITLTAAIVAWFAVQAQIKEQRAATERHRRDIVDARLTNYVALIFAARNQQSLIFSGPETERETRYSEFEKFRTSVEFLPLISDPILGKDHEAISFFANLLRNDAAIRLGKLASENAKNYEFVIEQLYARLFEMIDERRQVMRNGSVDDLVDLKTIRIKPYERALLRGGAIMDLLTDNDAG